MRFSDYLKDKVFSIFIYFVFLMIIFINFWIFNVNYLVVINIIALLSVLGIILLLHNFFRKKVFYDNLNNTVDNLKEKFFSTEIVKKPKFLEGKIIYDNLYKTNKAMIEKINKYKYITEDFKDYIEAWCHEIKTPVATSKMIIENNRNEINNSIDDELTKISEYIDQVLYYARSENVEKDYIIKPVLLNEVVNKVIKHNKKYLILKKIKINIENMNVKVNSDSKWLEFIINQIVVNSIKYSKDEDAYISFSTCKIKNSIVFTIEDNGIGIVSSEVDRVFQKGFTGSNGRKIYNSTGLGLYLCKKLCDKLEHNILIDSKENEGTKVKIIFPIDFSMQEITNNN